MGYGRAGSTTADPGSEAVAPFVDHVLYKHWLAGQLGSSDTPTATKYGPILFKAKTVSWAEAKAIKGDPDATRDLFKNKMESWEDTAETIKDEDPDAYAYLTGARTNRIGEALWTLAGTYTLLFPIFAFLLMMAGYLVVRFIVMTAPAWATIAIIPALQGTLRSALSVVAAAIINPIIMAAGASISVLVTGFLLNPDTGLGWLGLLLSVLFSALMWIVLKPYRRLTSLATGNPIADTGDTLLAWRTRATGFARTAAATAFGTAAGQALADDDENNPATTNTTTANPNTPTTVPADQYRRPEISSQRPSIYLPMTPADEPVAPRSGNVLVATRRPAAIESRAQQALTNGSAPEPPEPSPTVGDPGSPQGPSSTPGSGVSGRVLSPQLPADMDSAKVIDVSDPILSGEVIRRQEPTTVDGQELYVIYTPDEGLTVDDHANRPETEREV